MLFAVRGFVHASISRQNGVGGHILRCRPKIVMQVCCWLSQGILSVAAALIKACMLVQYCMPTYSPRVSTAVVSALAMSPLLLHQRVLRQGWVACLCSTACQLTPPACPRRECLRWPCRPYCGSSTSPTDLTATQQVCCMLDCDRSYVM